MLLCYDEQVLLLQCGGLYFTTQFDRVQNTCDAWGFGTCKYHFTIYTKGTTQQVPSCSKIDCTGCYFNFMRPIVYMI